MWEEKLFGPVFDAVFVGEKLTHSMSLTWNSDSFATGSSTKPTLQVPYSDMPEKYNAK